jgi:hypothetical protein
MAGLKECAARALSGVIGAVIGTVATLGLLGTGVVAVVSAHGGDASLIHSCVKPNGQITIIGASASCVGKEAPLDWAIQGEPGPAGADGEQGPPGPAGGVSGLEQVTQSGGGGAIALATANCPPGKVALGGGFQIIGGDVGDEFSTIQNRPNIDPDLGTQPNGWFVLIKRTSGSDGWSVTAFVVCANAAD